MHLSPAVDTDMTEMNLSHKTSLFVLTLSVLLFASPSFAACQPGEACFSSSETLPPLRSVMPSAEALAAGQKALGRSTFIEKDSKSSRASFFSSNRLFDEESYSDPTDPEDPLYKANQLAKQAHKKRASAKDINNRTSGKKDKIGHEAPPPEVETLQRINESSSGKTPAITDDPVNKEIAIDMRRDAQKEAALSYGARGGLAKRNYQIMESMEGFDQVLDKVFDFRSLLAATASGLLIEPPIIKEAIDAMIITHGGDEAAVADTIFNINKKAKIVTAPRDWRQYLVQSWSLVPPPPRVLWPKNRKEQASWSMWIEQGWNAGFDQAEQMFELNVNRLVADYVGMVRYKMLLAQGMISKPYALHEDRGITKNKNQMRVGDRALRITGPSQFLTGAELWKPADR